MSRGKAVSKEIRKLVVAKWKSGKSYAEISSEMNLSKSTVQYIIKFFKINNSVIPNYKNCGRVSKITPRKLRSLKNIIKKNRRSSVRKLANEWSSAVGEPIGRETTRKNLKKLNYGFYKPKEKPLLTKVQKRKRLLWAKARQSWTQRQWDSIIFSDESRFELCVSDTGTKVIRTKNEAFHRDCLKRTVKFPASVMIWGCMSANGMGKMCFIENTVNAARYIKILDENLIPSIPNITTFGEYTFQHDGAPAHTAKITKKWLSDNNINVLDWPSSSPDLNPIESVWAIMKRRLRNEPQTTVGGLKEKISEIWNSITPDECKTLIHSMNKRVNAVINAKGDVTPY